MPGESGLCCVCVTFFERCLTPLFKLNACASLCVCVRVSVCAFMLYALNFDNICICEERVSAWGLCGLGVLSIHDYY